MSRSFFGESRDTPGTENRVTVNRGNVSARVFLRGLDRNDYNLGVLDTPRTLSRRMLVNLTVFFAAATVRAICVAVAGTQISLWVGLTLTVPCFVFLAALVFRADLRSLELAFFFLLALGATLI